MQKYWKHIKPYWIFFVLSPLLMLIEVYCDVKVPSLAAQIINLGVSSGDASQILSLTGQMVLFVIVAICGGTGASYCATRASVNFSSDVRAEVFEKIQEFSFANIDKFSTGSLVTRLTNDITQLQQFVVMALRMMFRAPGMLVGAIVMAYLISPELSLVFLVMVPLLSLIIAITLWLSYKKFDVLQRKIDALNTNVQEVLTNIRVIKALTHEDYEEKRFATTNDDLMETGLSAYRITITQLPLMTIVINFGTVIVMWYGSTLLGLEMIQIGDISALITYLAQILMSVSMIAMVFLQSSRAFVSLHRISEVLETNVDVANAADADPARKVESGEIVFENVCFKYYKNNEELVLKDVSLTIASGQTVGVIGSTGCGKTSFINLIPRLYDVDSGAVYVDGLNVKNYTTQNLRDGVSVVLQNNMLFSGTIEENLRWGDEKATKEEIELVAQWAAAKDFVESKRDGYQTMLEQGGVNLSGGQKQRLCIARALLKRPKILILDDSTSAVDTATEATISHHLHSELKDTTKIIIAQRVGSVMSADMIVVMNDGMIEACGTHEELLENCGTYQEIYYSQMDKEVR